MERRKSVYLKNTKIPKFTSNTKYNQSFFEFCFSDSEMRMEPINVAIMRVEAVEQRLLLDKHKNKPTTRVEVYAAYPLVRRNTGEIQSGRIHRSGGS